ncbi:MAG: carbohydrate ABC transporter permease [Clostridiales bacterium]|nr:carbohydrate ABC transporter permease [Clostridiales bacterium]
MNGNTRIGGKKSAAAAAVDYIILTLALALTLFPLVYTFLGSFKSNMEIMTDPGAVFPKLPTLGNYRAILNAEGFNVLRLLWNSSYYTLANVFITVTISAMAGYVFARGEFPGKKAVFACFTALLFVKTGGLDIYPKMAILSSLHINQGLGALIFMQLFGIPIVNIYLVRGFVKALPRELDEAAEIDGCGFTGIFFRVIMPLLKPILATIAILAFQASWNDYLMPTIFTAAAPEQQTLIVGLMSLQRSDGAATSWNLMLAGSVVALLPVLAAYAVGNRFFISGLSAGAVKG